MDRCSSTSTLDKTTAKIAAAFGMRVVVHTRSPDPQTLPDINYVALDQLLNEADVISLSCPLTPETEKLINAERLGAMKETAYLINTGRGLLVDEAAVADALHKMTYYQLTDIPVVDDQGRVINDLRLSEILTFMLAPANTNQPRDA